MPGPTKKTLPLNFEVHLDDSKKICCKTCQAFDARLEDMLWMNWGSNTTHNSSHGHLANMRRLMHEQQKLELAMALYAEVGQAPVFNPGSIHGDLYPQMQWNLDADVPGLVDGAEDQVAMAGVRERVTWEQGEEVRVEELAEYDEYERGLAAEEDGWPEDEDVTIPDGPGMLEGTYLEEGVMVDIENRVAQFEANGDYC
ncbi:hypothetical protein K439DRAFT_1620912 [Ramaria rubella]|nr:hypothetical protein K439DRAFT_1620912 [Ramaria rubella]